MEIGGNVSGLSAIAGDLSGVAPQLEDIRTTLNNRVDSLVSDAGWNGDAADTFKGAWGQDGAACDELSKAVRLSGEAISTLATQLASAQRQLDTAVSAAKAAGVPVTDTGVPAGVYTDSQLTAIQAFTSAARAAMANADTARQTAADTLDAILSAINPDMADDGGDGTGIADLAGLGTVLKGYYVLPADRVGDIKKDIAAAKANYSKKHAEWKYSKPGSDARKTLAKELKDMRGERTELSGDLEDAEKLSGRFKGGELLGSSVGDAAKALGAPLEDGARLSRLLDGIPVLDVAAAGSATWAQAKTDHEEGWSWTHAILADGGANAAALGAGLATDAIPYVGPFVAPVVSYGVGAFVTEATHNAHCMACRTCFRYVTERGSTAAGRARHVA
ncbi:MAG TPA: WXG100 family type VII secretion target [Pseudonocardiaceae bacterium]|jgi:uncharacterized protein YukE